MGGCKIGLMQEMRWQRQSYPSAAFKASEPPGIDFRTATGRHDLFDRMVEEQGVWHTPYPAISIEEVARRPARCDSPTRAACWNRKEFCSIPEIGLKSANHSSPFSSTQPSKRAKSCMPKSAKSCSACTWMRSITWFAKRGGQ